MKKMINKYFCMAVALAAAGMTGCSEDEPNVNPTEGETVKTSFAISLPYQFGTRMSGDNVQANGNFLGMQNIRMFPLTTAGADNVALSRMITLGNIAADGLTNQTKVYNDVQVDVNTNNFLFYALAGSTAPSTTTAFANGYMTDNLSSGVVNTNDIKFNLTRIRKEANFATNGAAVLQALNGVAAATGWSTSQDEQLKALYDLYITNKAGSAASVKVLLEDLNNKMTALKTGSTATVAQAVIDAITTAKDAIDASTFPRDYNLPDGVAQVAWSGTAFKFVANTDVAIGSNAIDPTTICYPAGLYYMANTPIKTTDALDPVFPNFANWADGFADWAGTSVTATTRGIALTNPVQYAVASLAVKVKCATSTLPDNAADYAEDPTTGGQTQTITVPADGFKLTGVVIGGQPETVGWDFKNLAGDHLMNIYDNAVPADVTAKYGSESPINYTLVLEDLVEEAVSDKTQASVVNIALEFENTSGQSFYGQDGLVPAGAKFYLVGQLNLNADRGVTDTTGRTSVFSQDYTTTATFTISSLENAYNGIPDLRASKMKFGLAVDLKWQAGVSFDVTID